MGNHFIEFDVPANKVVRFRSIEHSDWKQYFYLQCLLVTGDWVDVGKKQFEPNEWGLFHPYPRDLKWRIFVRHDGEIKNMERTSGFSVPMPMVNRDTPFPICRFDDDNGAGSFDDTIVYFAIGEKFPDDGVEEAEYYLF